MKRPFGYLVIVIWILFEICDWGMSGFALGSVLIISRLVLSPRHLTPARPDFDEIPELVDGSKGSLNPFILSYQNYII